MKFICPHCNKETEDTVGGVLVDGFILECSECFDTTIIHFEAAQQSAQAEARPIDCNCASWFLDGTHHAECCHSIGKTKSP